MELFNIVQESVESLSYFKHWRNKMREKLIEKIIDRLGVYSTEDLVEKFQIDIHELVYEEIIRKIKNKELDELLGWIIVDV